MTARVICVGSSPSSGSTLLADLLDSVPGVLCGPELNIFCAEGAYSFGQPFKALALSRRQLQTRAFYAPHTRFFNARHLAEVGLDSPSLERLVHEASSLKGFVAAFASHYAAYRGRDLLAFAEKTPLNVAFASDFSSCFPDGLFVHVVRDGRSVVASLRRRGYTLVEAAFIWMFQTAFGLQSRRLANAAEVRFEELLASPFEHTAALVARIGIDVPSAVIEQDLRANEYRSRQSRVASWRQAGFTSEVRPALSSSDLSAGDVALVESLELEPDPARRFLARPITFRGLLEEAGYAPSTAAGHRVALGEFAAHYADYWAATRHQHPWVARLPRPRPGSLRRDAGSAALVKAALRSAPARAARAAVGTVRHVSRLIWALLHPSDLGRSLLRKRHPHRSLVRALHDDLVEYRRLSARTLLDDLVLEETRQATRCRDREIVAGLPQGTGSTRSCVQPGAPKNGAS